jgi:hypothetical protein
MSSRKICAYQDRLIPEADERKLEMFAGLKTIERTPGRRQSQKRRRRRRRRRRSKRADVSPL